MAACPAVLAPVQSCALAQGLVLVLTHMLASEHVAINSLYVITPNCDVPVIARRTLTLVD